jgi:hypothetical protein
MIEFEVVSLENLTVDVPLLMFLSSTAKMGVEYVDCEELCHVE